MVYRAMKSIWWGRYSGGMTIIIIVSFCLCLLVWMLFLDCSPHSQQSDKELSNNLREDAPRPGESEEA